MNVAADHVVLGPAAAAPLGAAADAFLDWLAVERGRSPNTLESYRRDLRRYVGWLGERGLRPETATPADVVDHVQWLRESGMAASSVARAVVVVRGLHRFLAVEEMTETDPAARLETPRRPAGIPKALSRAQVDHLIETVAQAPGPVGRRDLAMVEVLYGSGLRISEAVGLSVRDLDVDSRLLRVFGKGSKERIVPVGRMAMAALAEWLDDGRDELRSRAGRRTAADASAVFLNQRGGRLTRQGAWLALQGHARRAGLADVVSPHVLRHSCATHMLDGGADIRTVQELLGHASISTTQVYTKVVTGRLWQVYADSHPRARRTLPTRDTRVHGSTVDKSGGQVAADVHGSTVDIV